MSNDISYPPLDPATWPDRINHMTDSFAGRLNVYRVMAHNPDLLASWSDLRAHVVTENSLGPERLEIVILRVASRLGSDYEWSHHVSRSRTLGMSDERIFSIAGDPSAMEVEDALIAQAVDDLLDASKLEHERLAALVALVGRTGVLDMMATVGFYKTLGCIAETFDLPLDEGIEALKT